MGTKKNHAIDTIKVRLTFMPHHELQPKLVECNYWQWQGLEETAVNVFRVYGGRLVRAGSYNNVATVEEV